MTRGGAHEVISFDGAFHGRTLAMMRASGKPGWDRVFAPMPAGFAKACYNDITSVECAITPTSVAVMIELVQGEAGVNLADPGFVRELRVLTTERQLLLIADEVQTGIGRCGRAFAHELFGIEPDLMTLAKGIGGAVPLAALLCKKTFNCFAPGDQGGTYGGNPLMAAVGLAVVDTVCQDGFLAQVRQSADHLARGLQGIVQDHGLVAERGAGLLRALVLPTDTAHTAGGGGGAGAVARRTADQRAAPEPAAVHAGADDQRQGSRPGHALAATGTACRHGLSCRSRARSRCAGARLRFIA